MRSSVFLPSVAASWSREEIQRLRELAAQEVPIELMSATLRRTPSAIRNKAMLHGISIRSSARHRD